MKYFVYYNLHKHVFSLKNKKTGLVDKDKYSKTVMLENCKFKVSQKGRERVLKEQRKNVHAGVEGNLCSLNFTLDSLGDDITELYYNPYEVDSFVVKATKKPVREADIVYLLDKKIYARGVR